MDRTLKVHAKTGHLFAEFIFNYDHAREVSARYTQYRPLFDEGEEDEIKSVFPLSIMNIHLPFKQFASIDEIKAYDIELVKKELGRDMKDPATYTYTYDPVPVLLRYVVENHRGCIGLVNVVFSFIDNTKDVKFLSAFHPKFDVDISSNSLETNISCILRIPVYQDREVGEISSHDLKRLEPWY